MAFTIGRAGRSSPLILNDPSGWAVQAGKATVHVISQVSPATDALRLRDQLLGYQDNLDEPVVPVVVDSEPRLTGYYRVTGVQIDTDPTLVGLGILDAYISLEQVMGFTQPIFESILSGALLTNGVGGVLADTMGFHCVPGSIATANDYQTSPWPGAGAFYGTRKVATPSSAFMLFVNFGNALSANVRFTTSAAKFYDGAATLEQGSPLQPVVGRLLAQADTTNWRLANGMVRVTPNASVGKIDVSHYNNSTWSAVKTYALTNGGVGPNAWNSITVLRNSVEEVVIRLSMDRNSGTPEGLMTLDIALRRGDRLARMYVSGLITGGWKLVRDTPEAATAITFGAVTLGGIRATSSDGDGNRFVLLSYQTVTPTNDLVNGGITEGGLGTSVDFAIGSEIGGNGAIAPNRAVDLAQQYLAAQTETQRVVGR